MRRIALLLGIALLGAAPPPVGRDEGQEVLRRDEPHAERSREREVAPAPAAPEPVSCDDACYGELPPYELVGSVVSPDGATWCILDIRLQGKVPDERLLALWASLRSRQAARVGGVTCRFLLPGAARFDFWAYVDALGFVDSSSWWSLTRACEEGDVGLVEMAGACLIHLGGPVFDLPVAADEVSIRGNGIRLELRYWDHEGILHVIRPFEGARPICLGALMR